MAARSLSGTPSSRGRSVRRARRVPTVYSGTLLPRRALTPYARAMQTERLILRPLTEADVEALVALDGFTAVREAVDPFGEIIPADLGARAEYERSFVGRSGFLGAEERATGSLVGWFQFEPAGADGRERELGYRLRPDAQGRGYATEGARALVEAGFAAGDVDRVYAHALLSNRASIAVMERIGMVRAGPWEYRGLPGVEYELTGLRSAPAKRP
jgi:RimJ/RimL family protein N-acetyltransferase